MSLCQSFMAEYIGISYDIYSFEVPGTFPKAESMIGLPMRFQVPFSVHDETSFLSPSVTPLRTPCAP